MGSASSKFKKYLQHGDEYAAMQIYQNSPELKKNLDPNVSYGENHNHNTALHYAAKHGMKHLLRAFLNDHGGNPNKKNGLNETVLHCACQLNQITFSAHERRAACVQLLLCWKGVYLKEGGREKVDLAAEDKEGNTALHWAASSGLKRCVELLLAHGSPLFSENNDKLTPCDMAMRGCHHDIASLLESKMVFADNADTVNEDEIQSVQEEAYSGLRSQDLQEAKDQLLVDTSDMLKIPLFTAEALLRNNEWSRELLLEKWMRDPVECCQEAGVQAPSSVFNHGIAYESSTSPDSSESNGSHPEIICDICVSTIASWEPPIMMSCKHAFCKSCWESYLTIKIQDGDAHHIMCPAYQCHILVPVELIERLVSPEMARRYLQFDIKAFVESNKSIKWCPVAGCGRAVRLPEIEQSGNKSAGKSIPITSHAVDCGNSHFFCWECLGEAHAPSGCKQWQEWQQKIAEIRPEELKASCNESEDAANCLWLVTNSKPCPNCKSPIQKNEGCNHMKCSKCKFDFCWVCQEAWKKHSSATGGYFRCNRFEAVHKADEKQGSMISEALERNNQMQEISRFLHYYTRFRNHENSQKLEEPLLTGARQKMQLLACSLGLKSTEETGEKGTKFVEDGVRELLKARRVLCGSYVYGYYLEDDGYNKTIFEFMQNELEEVTEKLSEMIARPYLRTPKPMIVQTTALARRKRHEFMRAVAQGLIPPETPPSQRRGSKGFGFSEASTWLKNCDWADNDSDEENGGFASFSQTCHSSSRKDHQCNLTCTKHSCGRFGLGSDYNMELVIALEMSRLQMIEDRMKQANNTSVTPEPNSSISNNSSEGTDDQLKLAIQLSLQDTSSANKELSADSLNSAQEMYRKTNADFTVDCFLKSLANQRIDLQSLEVDVNTLNGKSEWPKGDKEFFFKPCSGNEDGRFQISDIHENGFAFVDADDYNDSDIRLRRSHSTGDLCVKRTNYGARIMANGDEPRYHLDSDHSSQHDDKPEEVARRTLGFPSSYVRTKQYLLLHRTHPEETSYEGQSSVEETTTSDSINADVEVTGIIKSVTDEDLESKLYDDCEWKTNTGGKSVLKPETSPELKKTENISKCEDIKRQNPFASWKAKLCSAHLPKTTCYLTRIAVNKSIGLLSDTKAKKESEEEPERTARNVSRRHSDHSIMFKQKLTLKCSNNNPAKAESEGQNKEASTSKSTSFLMDAYSKIPKSSKPKHTSANLRIKICKSPVPKTVKGPALETDSSNEYESETGIPKSPTLFISGVSISRTPEPKSPGLSIASNGRQSRSSSLSVPVPLSTCSLNISSNSLNGSEPPEPLTPPLVQSTTPASSGNVYRSPSHSPSGRSTGDKENSKSKSASEVEREKEVFRFPKSSTDGALSSVLHVQESNLSSDDFHEALFLLERSPKTRDSKRRKRSKKKDKDKDKEKEKDDRKEEASSAL